MVAWRTFSSMRITTSPQRCIMPKMGGFSVANVPLPRAPLSLFRRPFLPFFVLLQGGLYDRQQYKPRHIPPLHPVLLLVSYSQYLLAIDRSFYEHHLYGDSALELFAGWRDSSP